MRTWLVLSAALASAACGSADPNPPGPTGPALLVIENSSQYVLEELRLHGTLSYAAAANVLDAPLEVGQAHAAYLRGATYVTVFREKFAGGDLLALTTQTPVELVGERGYRVKVFDQSFRVLNEAYVPPATTSTVPDP